MKGTVYQAMRMNNISDLKKKRPPALDRGVTSLTNVSTSNCHTILSWALLGLEFKLNFFHFFTLSPTSLITNNLPYTKFK